MPTIDTVKEITKEKEQVDEEILKIKMQNDNLIKENNSIQIRLKSINQILTIQENQLEASQLTTSGATNAIYNEKKRQGDFVNNLLIWHEIILDFRLRLVTSFS